MRSKQLLLSISFFDKMNLSTKIFRSVCLFSSYYPSALSFFSTNISSSNRSFSTVSKVLSSEMSAAPWSAGDSLHEEQAREELEIWPLDESNVILLNQVHPRTYDINREPHEVYDLIAIGAGAGGLVSSKQSARRGAKSAMISEKLAGGDCLNVGCVPSKALLRSARAMKEISRAAEFGISVENVKVDFPAVMKRLRQLRAKIAPVDGHEATEAAGTHVFQGRGRLTGPNTLEVNGQSLKFKVCVLATGGRPVIPGIDGLKEAPYTTNERLFNLEELPPRMVILGAGVIALEMAQSFALLGSKVTVINRSSRLFESKGGDKEAGETLQQELEKDGVTFVSSAKVKSVETIATGEGGSFPLMKVLLADQELECECLLVATGRAANVENLGLEEGGVEYMVGKGVVVNDLGQSVSNPSVYAVGDCAAGVARLTHMAGEMAKLVVQNGLAGDEWKLSRSVLLHVLYIVRGDHIFFALLTNISRLYSLVVPAVAYTEPGK
jgi:pyruvate/2-oxoglutarate dehydrogenase complex dihydrolipoamide dehydrogenase (E3) component